jgi:hypothetical protein
MQAGTDECLSIASQGKVLMAVSQLKARKQSQNLN